jgi:hypothetical protein
VARSQRIPARLARQKRVGPAAQLRYESDERFAREQMKAKLSAQNKPKGVARRGRGETGMNAGTIGRARF